MPHLRAMLGLATTAAATIGFLVARPELDTISAVVLVVVAFTAWAFAVHTTRNACGPVVAAIVIGVVLVVAVLVPPRGSRDLWGYAVYGRIVSQHDASPYERVPAAFPHDPLLPLMGSGYHRTRSPYGPAFTAASAVGTEIVGDDPRANRLLFQGLEALAVTAALVLLWLHTRRVDALVWLGLNPLVVSAVVNDGHNDGLVLLCVLAGVLLVARRHPVVGCVVLGLAALVKLPALLALAGVAVWMLHRHGGRATARAVGTGMVVVVLGYALVGRAGIDAIGDSGQVVSRATAWTPVHDLLVGAHHPGLADAVPSVALVAVVGLAALLAFAGRRAAEPGRSAGGAAASFALGGSYVLPGYATWGLGALISGGRDALAWLVAAQGALLLVVYQLPHHADAAANGLFVHRLVTDVLPVALFVGALVIGGRDLRTERRGGPRLRFGRGRRELARDDHSPATPRS